jgi:hypothetical protein
LGTKVVLSGGDDRFIGEKVEIIGSQSNVTGEYVPLTGGNTLISSERVTNIKTRTLNVRNCLGSDPGSDPRQFKKLTLMQGSAFITYIYSLSAGYTTVFSNPPSIMIIADR